MTASRLAQGGAVDRTKPVSFSFDGLKLTGFAGDTVASALLANDVMLVGRSFKLHRPRGLFGAGHDDPGSMVERVGPRPATNQLATTTALEDGGVYRSVSTWPNARRDFGAVAQLFSRLLPAGFYYKTFMWPTWHLFEPFIRGAAGLGRVPGADAWQPVSESRFGTCDVLVVGAGPAGLAAALVAGRSGASVILADDGSAPGGRLGSDGGDPQGWAGSTWQELAIMPNVRLLPGSTAWGYHEHNLITVLERQPRDASGLDLRNWKIRAAQVIVAAGAFERPIAFANNDRPGVMLASAVRTWLQRFGVRAGQRAVVFTNNISAYGTAIALARAGAVVTVVDARPEPETEAVSALAAAGIELKPGGRICKAYGAARVEAADIIDSSGHVSRLPCDLVALSGGWNPAFHLASQTREARSVWHDDLATFVAAHGPASFRLAGAARAEFDPAQCAVDGARAAAEALGALGRKAHAFKPPELHEPFVTRRVMPLWFVPPHAKGEKVFVDLSGDVTTDDVGLALREGFDSIELLKRYTTAGMGVDQGKSGNVNVIGIVGALTGATTQSVGTTTFRPPFVPVEFGAIAGQRNAARLYPWRHTPLTDWHIAHGAVMYEAGLRWQRPGYYPLPGEDGALAATREARAVRETVGVYDGTPLGKFQLKGPDVPKLLDLLYISDFAKLAPRRGKYGVMLSDDGLIMDDGVVFRLDEQRWLLHSSTGAADRVHQHIEQILQVHRPDWRVSVIPLTSQWANATVCGPMARQVVAALQPDFDISREALPFMGMAEGMIGDIPVRLFRVSWTGEASFELNTPARYAEALWERIMAAGAAFGITPVGSEANHILRVEAGYISTGHEVDGTSDAYDLGLGPLVSRMKPDFIGKRSMDLRRLADPDRFELVGFLPDDPAARVPEGAPLTPRGAKADQEGFVSACVMSVVHDRVIALGLLKHGRARMGETVHARVRESVIPMKVVAPVFHDANRSRVKS
ncbi:MAG: 2Fe-2S iron-sulfur cluster-binding protein [Bosea sp. (in: a-proteobacteria)]